MLLGVELAEVSASEQTSLQRLLGGYSFFDGLLGLVSLLLLVLLFNGCLGVEITDQWGIVVLTAMAVVVAALLYEEVNVLLACAKKLTI